MVEAIGCGEGNSCSDVEAIGSNEILFKYIKFGFKDSNMRFKKLCSSRCILFRRILNGDIYNRL